MKAYILPIVWLLIISGLSLMPIPKGRGISLQIQNLDKLIHIIFYLILSVLVLRSVWIANDRKTASRKLNLILISGIIGYGLVIEWAQEVFFISRHFEILDIIANIIGTLSGYLIFNHLIKN